MKVVGLTIAITDMDRMLVFYREVFNLELDPIEMYGRTLYEGNWNNIKILFCPADLADNKAKQNRHQFDIEVNDIKSVIDLIKHNGGRLMGDIKEDNGYLNVGCYDPDENSMVVKEKI